MKWRKGPRPWTIWVFVIGFLTAALIGLVLAISNPTMTWFLWSKRVPWLDWTQDTALIASISMFTIALIPIYWIAISRVSRARWLVLGFSVVKLCLWFQGYQAVTYATRWEIIRLFEPAFLILALSFLFASASIHWLERDPDAEHSAFE